ncbi:hypothetical protein DPMN_122680 [Dreissena polymorpha]|uniref:Kinesin motor domain-containing protein n=1 Tax=Dreissena polymorpha TaxID=45954 RepID=A0A9D4GPG1_DREPO|nr:hypothetical protein DPMN_122680 [Dreissena polymorpha]
MTISHCLALCVQVFTALRSSQLYVPYRNSKLTQILQPSLGGDAKVGNSNSFSAGTEF